MPSSACRATCFPPPRSRPPSWHSTAPAKRAVSVKPARTSCSSTPAKPRTPARQYLTGESHLYLGRQYRLKLLPGDAGWVTLTRSQLLVSLTGEPDPGRVKALLHRWYLDRARAVFSEVVDASLRHFKGVERPPSDRPHHAVTLG